ncbi:MAG TPA: universal stress protein [Streptosporangiaceae bacterium]|nr:universal stress protein [Streptosporangiaceae bacterium]
MNQQRETAGQRIVVGVDGSPSSKRALRWATCQAALTGAAIEAVIAWQYPAAAGGYGWMLAPADDMDFEGVAAKALADSIADCVDSASPVQLTTTVREGNAAEVLLDCAKGADLLVVGSRGHGGFVGALLGSVSQHCAHHATCPLVIIRDGSGH